MSTKKEETASFVLRLSQKIFDSDTGHPEVQWRGNIRHVQSGDEVKFSTFDAAEDFVKNKLSDLTQLAIVDKPEEEQKGIISKSFDFWKKVATATPKIVIDSIKDPKKQAAHLQEQIQEQFTQIGDSIGQKIEETIGHKIDIGEWLSNSHSENKKILSVLESMSSKIDMLEKKIEKISTKK